MNAIHKFISGLILGVIDVFYPLFQNIMPKQTFRYAACGGFNTLLDISLFFVSYHYIFLEKPFLVGKLIISPHIAAFIVGFFITFPIGFYLSRYVVFQETTARKAVQLIKYFLVVMFCIILNYGFLKLFIETFGFNVLVAKIVTTVFVVLFSYFSQKYFTFKPTENLLNVNEN